MLLDSNKLEGLVCRLRERLSDEENADPAEIARIANRALCEAMQGLHLLPQEIERFHHAIDRLIAETTGQADTTALSQGARKRGLDERDVDSGRHGSVGNEGGVIAQ